ncbi:MAG: helix-turn-helix transcriptional regulator [Ferruginibacter sp.]
MNIILEIRTLTGLSYTKLAEWLGVSRSLLQFAESEKRSLPSEVMIRLSSIYLLLVELQKETTVKEDIPVSNPGKLALQHHKKANYHERTAASLRRQLQKLEAKHPQLNTRLRLIATLQSQNSTLYKTTPRDEAWLSFAEWFSKEQLRTAGQEAQEELRDKIEMHEAYAALHRERAGRYGEMED